MLAITSPTASRRATVVSTASICRILPSFTLNTSAMMKEKGWAKVPVFSRSVPSALAVRGALPLWSKKPSA